MLEGRSTRDIPTALNFASTSSQQVNHEDEFANW